jgi:hypothetical protein
MRISSAIPVLLLFMLAPLSFGATLTSCTNGANVSDGSGGFFVSGTCNFFREVVYPFDLTSFLTFGGAGLAENYQVPAYIVFTSDANEVNNQVGSNHAAWHDVLFFEDNVPAVPGSTRADLFWDGTLPSISTVDNFLGGGFAVYVDWNPSGTSSWIPNDRLTFTVHDNAQSVPEPSGLAMVIAGAGLALAGLRRRLNQLLRG